MADLRSHDIANCLIYGLGICHVYLWDHYARPMTYASCFNLCCTDQQQFIKTLPYRGNVITPPLLPTFCQRLHIRFQFSHILSGLNTANIYSYIIQLSVSWDFNMQTDAKTTNWFLRCTVQYDTTWGVNCNIIPNWSGILVAKPVVILQRIQANARISRQGRKLLLMLLLIIQIKTYTNVLCWVSRWFWVIHE